MYDNPCFVEQLERVNKIVDIIMSTNDAINSTPNFAKEVRSALKILVQTPPYDVPVHEVNIVEGSSLFKLLNVATVSVNSYHHQAVKELSKSLKAMAISTDGLVEAAEMVGKRFIWAVQWHPEFSYRSDENSMKIFREFVKNCYR